MLNIVMSTRVLTLLSVSLFPSRARCAGTVSRLLSTPRPNTPRPDAIGQSAAAAARGSGGSGEAKVGSAQLGRLAMIAIPHATACLRRVSEQLAGLEASASIVASIGLATLALEVLLPSRCHPLLSRVSPAVLACPASSLLLARRLRCCVDSMLSVNVEVHRRIHWR